MLVIDLAQADRSMVELVGGKAAGLGELIRAGERVPPGFCLTTEAHRGGSVPEEELALAYERIGGGRVAVRSSATAEDLPDASFAGQQETYLDVEGIEALVAAVRDCWDSLDTERAAVYRRARGYDGASMAVVVQRMVDPRAAGVLFTANPVTGSRVETVVDAAPGLGTAVVDGTVDPDRYVLGAHRPDEPEHGCLSPTELDQLHRVGQRLQDLFGTPQDAEWAVDHDGALWLLQSRAITTLFPLPASAPPPTAPAGHTRVYVEVGAKQGMLRPLTPLGMSLVREGFGRLGRALGAGTDPLAGPEALTDAAGRFFLDITPFLRDGSVRQRLPRSLRAYEARLGEAAQLLLTDPRFAPRPGHRAYPRKLLVRALLRHGPGALAGLLAALWSPDRSRTRSFSAAERARTTSSPPTALADPAEAGRSAQRLEFARSVLGRVAVADLMPMLPPVYAALLTRVAAMRLLRGVVREDEIDAVLRGTPHNVTTDMDLALWRLAEGATEHRALLSGTPPAELAELHRAGELPAFGLTAFLASYGHRSAAEVDIGVPRWTEDPTPVFAVIANYLRITDPAQAPDRRFETAAREAESALAEVARRGRRARPLRGSLAAFLLRRARALAGLRELPKFTALYALAAIREQLLAVGAELADRGLLERASDIVYLTLAEAEAAASGPGPDERTPDDGGWAALATERRESHARETRRRHIPGVLLSDGTEVEATLPPPPETEGVLAGVAAAPGTATGRARVILDPTEAHLEPGEILVAPTTDPGWTPLFLTAAGLVTETGSAVAHGPTVAREYGIPAVVGARGATLRIETGQVITVNGATGTVLLDENEPEGAVPQT